MASFLDSAAKLAKQGVAGLLEPFYSPESVKDVTLAQQFGTEEGRKKYLPVGITAPIAPIYKLIQAGTDLAPIPYRLYNKGQEEGFQRYLKAGKQVNSDLGISDPANGLELAARIGGGILLPGPKLGEISKGVDAAGKAAEIAKRVGKVGVEMAVPLRQGGAGTVTAATGLGVGLQEAVDTIDDQKNYKSVGNMMLKKGVVQPTLRDKPFEEYLDPSVKEMYDQAVATGDTDTQDEIQTNVMQLQNADHAASYVPPQPWYESDEAKEAAVLGASAVAGYFGSKALANTRAKLLGSTTDLAGQTTAPHLSDVTTKATQGFVQNDHMIRDATAVATGDKGRIVGAKSKPLQQWLAKLDTVTNPAIHSKQSHFALTGELPNSSTTARPLGPMLDGIEQTLTPAEKDMLTDGLLAGTALDDYRRTGVQTAFTQDRAGNPVSQADVQHYFDLVQNNPKLKAVADTVREHYRKQLDYMKEHGIISQDQYTNFIEKRPNFVHMSKNEAPDTVRSLWSRGDNADAAFDRRINMLGSRSDSVGGGVNAGAAADPIAELPNQWSKLIREIEIGRVKKQWLAFAEQSPELKQWIKKIPVGVEPEGDASKLHTVFENGMAHHYYVKDPALSEALNFQPFAQTNALSGALNVFRRNFEYFTTGAGNPFFAPVAASYDTFTGMALKPKDYNLGVINEVLAHINPKLGIGTADPTWIVSAPIGAARHAWDSLVGGISSGLARELEANAGPVLNSLGPQLTKNIQTKLASMYQSSIKSQMDEAGVANANIFSSNRPDRVAPGLSEIAPKFATGVAERAFREAIQGDHSLAQKMLAGSHYAFEATRSSAIARLYSGVLKSIHEGFRYQAYATNRPRIVDADTAERIASQTRRIAADIGQKGAGELAQSGMNSLTYANAGVQSLAQIGRMFRDQPASFTLNTMTSLLGLASLYYGPALISGENRAKMREKTEEQRMAAFTTFGGLEVKVPPELRPIWGSVIAVLDDASGLNSTNEDGTDNFDPNFASAIQGWLDNGLSEPGQQDVKANIKEGLWGMMPATWGSSPVVNGVMAASTGLDISYSRYTGQPQTIKPQAIDPLGGEGEFVDDAISANWQKAIEDVSGTMLSGYIRAGLDVQRAIKDDHNTLDQGMKVAASRIVDTAAKQTGPASIMFGDYDRKHSPNDGEMKLYQKKKLGFQKAIEISNKDILTPFTDGKDPRSASLSMLDPLDLQQNTKLLGTALVPIGAIAAETMKQTGPIEQQITNIRKKIEGVSNQKASTIEERNRQINELNEEREGWIKKQNNIMRMAEDTVRQNIGDPTFTFQDFGEHFDKYERRPWPPVPQPSVDGTL